MCYHKQTLLNFGFSFSLKIGNKKDTSNGNDSGAIPRMHNGETEVWKYDTYRAFFEGREKSANNPAKELM